MRGLLVAAAGAAAIGLTACTHAAAPGATHADHHTAGGAAIAPVSCSQQYRTWNHGAGKGVMHALDAVTSAATARNAHARKVALRQAKRDITRATRHPIPACADPRGYWTVLLMHVDAAVAGKGSASSVRAAMQAVPKIHRQLVAEVTQTIQ